VGVTGRETISDREYPSTREGGTKVDRGKEVNDMPFVRVTSFPQTKEVRTEIAKGITEVVSKATKFPKEYIWVVFEPMPQDSWSVGGTLVSDKK
jgi:4-oxalocrotonate tautomerase family enzyme